MDSKENMAKLVLLYVMLSIYAADIVYLWRLQKSLKFAILECKKSKICDFLQSAAHIERGTIQVRGPARYKSCMIAIFHTHKY